MKSLLDYISRIGKARGFGIQSPWAYSFVRDVIMEELPYYAYADIESHYPDRKAQKLQKLYFRLRNYQHSSPIYIINACEEGETSVVDIASAMKSDAMIVLENPFHDNNTKKIWEELNASPHIGVCFDLYDVIICFAKNEHYKRLYKLNF